MYILYNCILFISLSFTNAYLWFKMINKLSTTSQIQLDFKFHQEKYLKNDLILMRYVVRVFCQLTKHNHL